ncbi:phosphoribosylanthranilate isomerase [Paenibacillus larvae]|nr:phosphoribosylanthranilate isomerase [Paenibacillus larvae]MDT2275583.1 phosphoribosylanthranilate isomerase [Paenibacillus larvae]
MTDAVHKAGFDFVQLHGDESPEFCCWVKENLNVGIFKAFCITPDIKRTTRNPIPLWITNGGPIRKPEWMLSCWIHWTRTNRGNRENILLGKLPVYLEWSRRHHVPLFVAGGLNDNNVSELISDYHPYGVDVSSGVETDGWKDPDKIKRFVERVAACG